MNMSKLKPNQKKFVAEYVKESNGTKAAQVAYGIAKPSVAAATSSRLLKNVNIQEAIDAALEHHGATPEYAIGVLKQVADQDDEIGARRLAAKDILELHGWKRGDRPTVELQIANAFFNETRQNIIDQD